MENQKDSQNIGHHEKDSHGQFLHAGNNLTLIKNADEFAAFGQTPTSQFSEKKAEKLSAAVYLVTGHVSDNEPLKWEMRKVSLSVMSFIRSSDTNGHTKSAVSDIEQMISLIGLARLAGFLSDMNAAILHEEYRTLAAFLKENRERPKQSAYVFSREFFAVKENENTFKGQLKDITTIPEKMSFKPQLEKTPANDTPKKIEKNSRREVIVNLVKEKGEVSIKDIVSNFSDCGEKTIQRELLSLVSNGILKKEGDRRWSKYSIA